MPPLSFITTFDNACIWILKLKAMNIQAFLFNGKTYLLIATHTYIEFSSWTSTGFSRTRTAAHPITLKTSTTQLDKFFLKAWTTSWILPVRKSPWLRAITWTGKALSGRAKAVPGCMLTIKWHGGSQDGAWTFNWSLDSCWRNSPNVTAICLTGSLCRAGYSLNFCGKNTNSNPVLMLHPADRENDTLEKAFCFIWANVLTCLSAIPFQVVGRTSVTLSLKDKTLSCYLLLCTCYNVQDYIWITAKHIIASALAYTLNSTIHCFVTYFSSLGRWKVLYKMQVILIIQLGNRDRYQSSVQEIHNQSPRKIHR